MCLSWGLGYLGFFAEEGIFSGKIIRGFFLGFGLENIYIWNRVKALLGEIKGICVCMCVFIEGGIKVNLVET